MTLQAFSTSAGVTRTMTTVNGSSSSYAAGSFTRDKVYAFTISESVGTLYGLGVTGGQAQGVGGRTPSLTWKFTTPFAKSGSDIFKFTVTYNWQRVLDN